MTESPVSSFSGLFGHLSSAGANSVLFSKSLTYIITAPWPSQLHDWYCWAVLAAFVATGGYWVHRTAAALRKFPAGLVMSVMQVGCPVPPDPLSALLLLGNRVLQWVLQVTCSSSHESWIFEVVGGFGSSGRD